MYRSDGHVEGNVMKLMLRLLLGACLMLLPITKATAEENPNQLLTILGGTTISGYVDTSAHWAASAEPLPEDYQALPTVFISAPRVVREFSTPGGNSRLFQFTVHRLGRGTNEITVYLNFHSPNGIPVQGGVTIPTGKRIGTTVWQVRDNGLLDGPRHFSATISLSAVRQQLPGARYKLHGPWPHAATVLILDPFSPTR